MIIERRIATEDDLKTLFQINERAMKAHIIENFGEWDGEQQWKDFESSTDFTAHELLLDETLPFGFVNVFRSVNGIHLNRLCIVPEYQRIGIGTKIIQEIISSNTHGRPIRLQVFLKNPAFNLYRRLGFKVTKRTPTHIHMVYVERNG
jgi:GNAT superfamily N-acetyltransferase